VNLRGIANGLTQAINPNLIGILKQSAGYGYPGDASVTGSITGTELTVSSLGSGQLAVGSVLASTLINQGTYITAFGSGQGGVGTYTVSQPQTAESGPISASGNGQRQPIFTVTPNVPMQFQALSSDELRHVDALNIATTMRAVHMNGDIQGLDRPGVRGGDILLAPTGLTGAAMDTFLVVQVLESFDASGWCRLAVALQQATQSQ
jgi:hypothetical protein